MTDQNVPEDAKPVDSNPENPETTDPTPELQETDVPEAPETQEASSDSATLYAGKHLTLDRNSDQLGLLCLDVADRSVNILATDVVMEFKEAMAVLEAETFSGLIIFSGKKDFLLGANVEEIAAIDTLEQGIAAAKEGHQLFQRLEDLPYPTCAAIHGQCLGGGTEMALACTYRVASLDARLALPEVKLGILPGWGGTQRMTQLIGISQAADLILSGRTVTGKRALAMGLVNMAVPEGAHLDIAADILLGHRKPKGPKGGLKKFLLDKTPFGKALVISMARKAMFAKGGHRYPGPPRILRALQAAGSKGGYDLEATLLGECLSDPRTHHVLDLFLNLETTKKVGRGWGEKGFGSHVAVIGAGIMGGGIAQAFASKGSTVRLKDLSDQALQAAMDQSWSLLSKQVKRRRLSPRQRDIRQRRILPGTDNRGLQRTDLVVEAVVEKMEVKRIIFNELQSLPGAERRILASNTSSLPITLLQEGMPYPGRIVGMHFFNPVHRMPLVEVISGVETDPEAAHQVFAMAVRLGKTPVLVKDSPGFLVNRILMPYMTEAVILRQQGVSTQDIDQAAMDFGMPMGPLDLLDTVGIDTALHVGRFLRQSFGERMPASPLMEKLVVEGHFGVKTGRGFYRHGKNRDKQVRELAGFKDGKVMDLDTLQARLFLPMVLESNRALQERIVSGPDQLDLAMILGTGFPPWRGGPMAWLKDQGHAKLADKADTLAETEGLRFDSSGLMEP